MAEQNTYNNTLSNANANSIWFTQPPPRLPPSQSIRPIYNLDYRMPFLHPNVPSCNIPSPISTMLPYNCNISNFNSQHQHVSLDKSNLFPPLPDNIDKEYILKYLCPIEKAPKDKINIFIENWLATIDNELKIKNVKTTNVKINEISSNVKECKQLLDQMNNTKQLMKQSISSMVTSEWEKSCSNLLSIQEQIENIIKKLNLDRNSLYELKMKLIKRKKKRDRLKRLKSNLQLIKSQKKEEITEINRKIDAWQNTLKENIIKEKIANKTKIEANIVLKGVRSKIEDAKNRLTLLDTLVNLRKCRLRDCVNKRKNLLLEESLSGLKILWQQKLVNYYKEENYLKNMLSTAEAEKHKKRENEIQEILTEWDKILFGPNFKYHEIVFDNLYTFLNIRKDWDNCVVNGQETQSSSNIPIGWIIPSVACNSDWAKYLNNVDVLQKL